MFGVFVQILIGVDIDYVNLFLKEIGCYGCVGMHIVRKPFTFDIANAIIPDFGIKHANMMLTKEISNDRRKQTAVIV